MIFSINCREEMCKPFYVFRRFKQRLLLLPVDGIGYLFSVAVPTCVVSAIAEHREQVLQAAFTQHSIGSTIVNLYGHGVDSFPLT
ncbi:MAG: hypothetical protein ACI8WM_001519 [Burkholderiaceae bacterium]|jgi:hypothetical protein